MGGAPSHLPVPPPMRVPIEHPLAKSQQQQLHHNHHTHNNGNNHNNHHNNHHIAASPTQPPSSSKKWNVTIGVHRTLICRFCGGKTCKHEDWRKQKDKSAIEGLNSTWISSSVLAMQRPSTRLLQEYELLHHFTNYNIGAVFNLQVSGEHPLCGDGIGESGFSYEPQHLMNANIMFYNHGWVDMATPSLEMMLSMVQCMSFHVERGQKIAVHCHAGYGRTGIAIACFFIYIYGFTAAAAIKSVRERRSQCIQTKKQREFVVVFGQYMTFLRSVYYMPPTITSNNNTQIASQHASNKLKQDFEKHKYTLHEFLSRQRALLHGPERNELRFIPKIISVICARLTDLAENSPFLLCVAFIDGFRSSYEHRFQDAHSKEKTRRKLRLKLDRERNSDNAPHSIADNNRPSTTNATYLSRPNVYNTQRDTPEPERSASPQPSAAHHERMLSSPQNPRPSVSMASPTVFDYRESMERDPTPKWTLTQSDTYDTIKSKINVGDYSMCETCDIRFCAQLLLEWLDQLKSPLIPILHQQQQQNNSNARFSNLVLVSSANAFESIPRYIMFSLNIIMRMLFLLQEAKHIDSSLITRVYARFAFSLLHPTCDLPESLTVVPPIIAPKEDNQASKATLDSMVEFMGNFTRSWDRLYSYILEAEENNHTIVGVRKVKSYPAPEEDQVHASVAMLPAPINTQLQPPGLDHLTIHSPVSGGHQSQTQHSLASAPHYAEHTQNTQTFGEHLRPNAPYLAPDHRSHMRDPYTSTHAAFRYHDHMSVVPYQGGPLSSVINAGEDDDALAPETDMYEESKLPENQQRKYQNDQIMNEPSVVIFGKNFLPASPMARNDRAQDQADSAERISAFARVHPDIDLPRVESRDLEGETNVSLPPFSPTESRTPPPQGLVNKYTIISDQSLDSPSHFTNQLNPNSILVKTDAQPIAGSSATDSQASSKDPTPAASQEETPSSAQIDLANSKSPDQAAQANQDSKPEQL